MNLKIDLCSYKITQLTCQKGIKSLWQSSEQLLNCQGSLMRVGIIPRLLGNEYNKLYQGKRVEGQLSFSDFEQ